MSDQRFLVVLGHDGKLEYAPIAEASYREYAGRHGYSFHVERLAAPGSHPSWQKLELLCDLVASPRWGWILWADTDSVVTNQTTRLGFVDGFAHPWMLVSRDWSDASPWSAGVMLISACFDARQFLSDAMACGEFKNTPLWDQSAMHKLCKEKGTPVGLEVLPRRVLQSVPADVFPQAAEPWQPGDFIAHITGIPQRKRLALMQKYAGLAVR